MHFVSWLVSLVVRCAQSIIVPILFGWMAACTFVGVEEFLHLMLPFL